MEYIENGRLEIVENYTDNPKSKQEKPVWQHGTIVYCRGNNGTGSFYGIVYSEGVLELECGSNTYIQKHGHLHLGDTISYWTIERVCKAKLIIEGIVEEE